MYGDTGLEVEISYRRKDSVEVVRSKFLNEDERYLYLECGRYVKNRVIALKKLRPEPPIDDEEE